VWQFKFACYPQVQDISSIIHQLSCFGGGFLLCLFTGDLFICFAPFLWDKVNDLSATPLLSVCCDGSLFVLQFFRACLTLGVAHWLRGLLLWSATYPTSGSNLSPTCCRPFCLSSHLFTDSSDRDWLCASVLIQCAFRVPAPSAVC
jgi:hypothetical protein